MVSLYWLRFQLLFWLEIRLFIVFLFTSDGRSDYGPGRSKGGGIYANGQ